MRRAPMTTGNARALAMLLGAIMAACPLLLPARPAQAAATFTVNSTADRGDQRPGNRECVTGVRILSDNGGTVLECTLRAAIQEANATAGADLIRFNIPGTGVQTIRPASSLPVILEPLTIDGYTQPGTSVNTAAVGTNAVLRIELDGTNSGGANGLWIAASNSLVRGLVINRFILAGIHVSGATTTGVRIAGCFLGTDPTGNLAGRNRYGVYIEAPNTLIGGSAPANRNLISGNGDGVILIDPATGSVVQGNLIGTDKTGTNPLGNGIGVLSTATNIAIGGNIAGAGNVIAFNEFDGVRVERGNTASGGTTGNRILRNSIFANGGLGINLFGGTENAAGATANDPGDGDGGPNTLQNKPVLTAAVTTGAATTIRGVLPSTPDQTFILRFFANLPGGNEGQTFLGQLGVTTNANGNAFFRFAPFQRVAQGQTITATATNGGGDTSEFSPPRTVESGVIG